MLNSSPCPASFAAKGFQKNHRAFQKDKFSKKKCCRSKAPTQPSETKSCPQSNSFIFKRSGPMKAIPKTETKRKASPETAEHPFLLSSRENLKLQ